MGDLTVYMPTESMLSTVAGFQETVICIYCQEFFFFSACIALSPARSANGMLVIN